jgi:1-acyl-sn-glycerol-3-phosphate acyltransferase
MRCGALRAFNLVDSATPPVVGDSPPIVGDVSGIREQVYGDPRPAEAMRPYHAWAREHEPGWIYPAFRVVLTPIVLGLYRTRSIGRDNVPASGAMILAPNHFSNMDHFFLGVWLRRKIRFMSKSQFFGGNPVVSYVFRVAGHFPVRRGHSDEDAFVTAHSILARGGCVGMYAEGGRSRSGGLGEPRPGIGRLALESGAPVVPVAIHGSERVRQWRRGRFPRVTVSFGEPLRFERVAEPDREQSLAAAHEIFGRVRELFEPSAGRCFPTP